MDGDFGAEEVVRRGGVEDRGCEGVARRFSPEISPAMCFQDKVA